MSHPLIDRSQDLRRLREVGYDLSIERDHLLVHGIPYVTAQREVKYGTLASNLTLNGEVTARPEPHTIFFAGEYPCDQHGVPIAAIRNNTGRMDLGAIVVDHQFSNKPSRGFYEDYFEKVDTYARIISHPASVLDAAATPKSFGVHPASEEESVFVYMDTASSRAGLTSAASRFFGRKIGIVGLGGTGSYILDLVAKTPVAEIHLFDDDHLLQHNAFRAPGAVTLTELGAKYKKALYYQAKYSAMHRKVIAHDLRVGSATDQEVAGLDFAFVAVDNGRSRREVIECLVRTGVPFIDVGMGVFATPDGLSGIVRVTAVSAGGFGAVKEKNWLPLADPGADDEYVRNMQLADLNALNATLAVIKWKKLVGFYRDARNEDNSTYTVDAAMLLTDQVA